MEYGLIGKKLGHSFSPEIHKSFADYNYQLKELGEEELESFFKEKNFLGINVTIPYKESVIKYLDEIDNNAKKIGAVNTVVNKGGKLIGYNTDYYGLNYLLEKNNVSVKGLNCAVLGSGGASKMATVLLNNKQAKSVITVSRKGEYNYLNQSAFDGVDLIINASPVGMYPNNGDCLINISQFKNLKYIVDLVYNPYQTELMYLGRQKGVKCINGLSMLVAQAKRAVELFLGVEIKEEKIEKVINEIKNSLLNLIFIGMPSSGKSTLASRIAKHLNREFVDLDLEFERVYGETPAQCIINSGELAFREKESKIVKEVCKKSRLVIATGGGAVKREDNQKAIKANGICFYIKRDLSLLITKNRPLSNGDNALQEMYLERNPIYLKLADYVIENNADIDSAIDKIKNIIG